MKHTPRKLLFFLAMVIFGFSGYSQTDRLKELLLAAEQGYVEAQCNLGVMYGQGEGVSKNYQEALRWYQKAAAQGHARAKYNLGLMYHNGEGVPQDYAEAAKWYSKSADQGHANAQYDLGVMYYFGVGVPKDYVLAYMWANLAATNCSGKVRKLSVELLNDVGVSMTREQIAEAQRLAREWGKPRFQ